MNGVGVLIRKDDSAISAVGCIRIWPSVNQEEGLYQGLEYAGTLIVDF